MTDDDHDDDDERLDELEQRASDTAEELIAAIHALVLAEGDKRGLAKPPYDGLREFQMTMLYALLYEAGALAFTATVSGANLRDATEGPLVSGYEDAEESFQGAMKLAARRRLDG